MEILNSVKPYFLYLLSGIAVLVVLAVRSFAQEKGKLKAIKSENGKLVAETEKIKSQYNKELEELKRDHQLDISKRKYLYESKKEQYIKFFQMIDKFADETNRKSQEEMLPIISDFTRNFIQAQNNKKKQAEASIAMSNKTQKLMMESNQDFLRIKQETNTIKIIASDDILIKLELFETSYQNLFDETNIMMENLSRVITSGDQQKLNDYQLKIQIAGKKIENIKNDLIQSMRIELRGI